VARNLSKFFRTKMLPCLLSFSAASSSGVCTFSGPYSFSMCGDSMNTRKAIWEKWARRASTRTT
jgi:hypothetical protein